MSFSQPPSYPPPPPGGMYPPPPPGGTQPPTARKGFFDFRGMKWWEIVLVAAPLTLVGVGGAVGGACGAVAAVGNTYIARSGLSVAVKVLSMIGLLIAAYVLYFIVALLIYAAVRSATG